MRLLPGQGCLLFVGRLPAVPVVHALLLLVMSIVLAGCASLQEGEAPAVVHPGVHSGGSVVSFSQSGELVASGGWEGTVRIWQLPAGDEVRHWRAHDDSVNGIVFLEQDREVVSAGFDAMLVRRGLDGTLLQRLQTPGPITHMVADVPAALLLTGHDDGTVRLWQLGDFTLLYTLKPHRRAVKAVAIAPGGSRFASSSADGSVAWWQDADSVQPLQTPPADAWTLAFSPDGEVLTGGSWFRLYRWQLPAGTLTTIPTEHLGIIKSVEYFDAGRELATISRQTDSAVYFLDPENGAVRRRFQRHDLCGGDIAVSPDGRYLATTSDDASVRFWVLEGDVEEQ